MTARGVSDVKKSAMQKAPPSLEYRFLNIARLAAGKHLRPKTSVFRFISLSDDGAWAKLEKMLKEQKLTASAPVSMNDPFESRPCVIDDLSSGLIDTLAANYIPPENLKNLSAADKYKLVNDGFEIALKSLFEDTKIVSFTTRLDSQSWSRKSAQDDKWSFCLTTGTLCPANQERPCRDDCAETTHRPSRRR